LPLVISARPLLAIIAIGLNSGRPSPRSC
jgi:hypothetical protein